MSELRHHLVNG